jgi:signal transduction histidine kinase
MSAITWLFADLFIPITFTHPLVPYWNAAVRWIVFLTIVSLGSALKNLNRDLEKRVKDRTALLEEEVVERKKIEKRLQEYARRLEILHEIDQAILAAESLNAIANETIKHIQNMLRCDFVSFMLLDFETHRFVLFEPSAEQGESELLEKHIPMDESPDQNDLFELSREDHLLIREDRMNSPLDLLLFRILRAGNYRSLLVVPILAQNELIGTLNLMSYQWNDFSPEHQVIGREIANQLGIAITQTRLVNQMRTDQENLQALSRQLLDVQEMERRNIARELHDEIGQALTGIGLTLEMATKREMPNDSLKQARDLVVELMEQVSQLSLELRPALLDDLGLLPALLWLIDRYSAQTSIRALLKHSGLEGRRFDPQIETAAYRIVQEALTNIARHARVKEAVVTIWYDQNSLGIQVVDQGQGFAPDTVSTRRSSSGLFGMQERASLLNGKLTIESEIGKGTRILSEIPAIIISTQEGTENGYDRVSR